MYLLIIQSAQDGLQKSLGLLRDAASIRSGVNSGTLGGELRNDIMCPCVILLWNHSRLDIFKLKESRSPKGLKDFQSYSSKHQGMKLLIA